MSSYFLRSLLLLCILAFAVESQAALVNYWAFNDGSGTIAVNTGTNGEDANAVLQSADTRLAWYGVQLASPAPDVPLPVWTTTCKFGGYALQFTGVSSPTDGAQFNYVGLPLYSPYVMQGENASLSMWVQWNGIQPQAVSGSGSSWTLLPNANGCVFGQNTAWVGAWGVIGLNNTTDPSVANGLRVTGDGSMAGAFTPGLGDFDGSYGCLGSPPVAPGNNVWNHIVMTVSPEGYSLYMNGQLLRTNFGVGSISGWGTSIGAVFDYNGFQDTGMAQGGSNSIIDDVGIFDETLSVGKARAIYTTQTLPGLEGYDLGKMNTLFGVYDSGEPQTIGSLSWEKITGLSRNPGDAWIEGGYYYVQLGSSDGVRAIPEPGMLVLLAASLVGLPYYVWRKRR